MFLVLKSHNLRESFVRLNSYHLLLAQYHERNLCWLKFYSYFYFLTPIKTLVNSTGSYNLFSLMMLGNEIIKKLLHGSKFIQYKL